MARETATDPKLRWIRALIHSDFAKAGGAPGGAGDDTDLMNPNDGDAPAAPARRGNDTDLMDPNEGDAPAKPAGGHEARVKHAAEERDSANQDVAAKEEALDKAKKDLDAAQANAEEKTEEYYEEKAAPEGAPAVAQDLPRPMQPDCVPDPGKIDGPKDHVLCKTHGHVLNLRTKMIIANTPAQYTVRHPLPRPMESDCKPVAGKLPYAPDNIVLCEPHGHVIDKTKKLIIANTVSDYLKAHPQHGGAPKSDDKKKDPAAPSPAATDQPPLTAEKKTTYSGDWKGSVGEVNDIDYLSATTAILEDGRFNYTVSWMYSSTPKPKTPVPILARVEILLINAAGKDIKTITEKYHALAPGAGYTAADSVPLPQDAFDGEAPAIHVYCTIQFFPGDIIQLELNGQIDVKVDEEIDFSEQSQ
jgi:hypothetical protein